MLEVLMWTWPLIIRFFKSPAMRRSAGNWRPGVTVRMMTSPFIFYRDVTLDGETVKVEVDLLAGEYEGTGRRRRTQKIQDARARKARGCDLVFSIEDGEEILISGIRPDGHRDSVRIKVAGVVSFLVMKGMALADRENEKDAYDIYFVLKNFPEELTG